ncbi:hypothetical protein RJ492_004938 [Pluralibacter gergoviae]|uniref:Uncharacterized protein n=1 Tax=Pluralibacter gergoviae TaxID=61647 RepID=A0AAI9DJS5_PLUGE|nr:hypothetical protein [Pluralibacter gergoviae]EKX1466759.1 hypothetical protein [Klebsiella pneumoniae]EKV9909308.1 hypothetical protein [Pluralibacter gergoviae]EKW7273130.1 hypothetical protein [Pluralibacter gergoviae]EKW9973950.1 hypothetical protein [Pluralibacter gergoviae]
MAFTVKKVVNPVIKIPEFFPLELKSLPTEVELTFTAVDSLFVNVSEPYYEISFDVTSSEMHQKGRYAYNFYTLNPDNLLLDAEAQLLKLFSPGSDAA